MKSKKEVEVIGLYDAGIEIGYSKAVKDVVEFIRHIAEKECDNTDSCPCGHLQDLADRLESRKWKT